MDVDTISSLSGSLAAEFEQINKEITATQISSQTFNGLHCRSDFPNFNSQPMSIPVSLPLQQPAQQPAQKHVQQPAPQPMEQPLQISVPASLTATVPMSTTDSEPLSEPPNEPTITTHIANIHSIPSIQQSTSAQVSENTVTSLPHESQPVAEAEFDDSHSVKSESAVPEIIEIKEELTESAQLATSDSLLSPGTFQQLMSSLSNREQNIQNFVPSATPSSLPPSFLDRSDTNSLSMLGSMGSGDGPGPSGMNVPNISDSML